MPGTLPSANIHSTWSENLEIWDIETDEQADLSDVTEVRLLLRDPKTRMDELSLTMTNGDITITSPGILEWRVEADAMGTVRPKLYELILLLENATDTVSLFIGPISITE